MREENKPCNGCTPETGRCANPNCHETCEKYLKYTEELEREKLERKERKRMESLVYGTQAELDKKMWSSSNSTYRGKYKWR